MKSSTSFASGRAIAYSIFLAGLLSLISVQCTDLGSAFNTSAKISVYVHWGTTPISQMKVELVQTGEVKYTDQNGIADFVVSPGNYVIRVYNLNRGGPVFMYVDFPVEAKSTEVQTLDIVDCLACA